MKNNEIASPNQRLRWDRGLLYVILFLFWLLFYWHLCVVNNSGDYYAHNTYAEYIKEGKASLGFYPLYHLLVIAVSYLLMGSSSQVASAVLLPIAMLASIEVIRWIIAGMAESNGVELSWCVSLLAAVVVSIIQPIFTFTIPPGYSSGNGYISPTQAAVKPFALLSIYFMWRLLVEGRNLRLQVWLTIALILSCLAKPMFAMAFIPAMGIYYLIDVMQKYRTYCEGTDCIDAQASQRKPKISKAVIDAGREYLLCIWPLFVSGLVLVGQYCTKLFRSSSVMSDILGKEGYGENSSILFGWMAAWPKVVSNVPLSILFAYFGAIVFLLLYAKQLVNKKYWLMTTLYTLVSFIYISCLYESGVYITDLNFRNSWIISFLLVYIGCFAELCIIGMGKVNSPERKFSPNEPTMDGRQTVQGIYVKQFVVEVIADKKYLASLTCLSVHLLFGLALIAKNLIV